MNKLAAKNYASLGMCVMLCHCIRDGICSCGRPQCVSPGKHPATPNGLLDATTNQTQIDEWWSAMPDGNIGIAMKPSGLFSFDLDLYHDDLTKLATLEIELGPLPETVTQRSGSGEGYHTIFKHPGFDTRGTIGNIVTRSNNFLIVAPSNHLSGGNYVWQEGLGLTDTPLSELPDSWKEALRKTAKVSAVGIPTEEPEWLAKIPQDKRIADMKAHFFREAGEVKGSSAPGTTFNIVRSAIRAHAVKDPEAALEAAMEFDKKCVPPWDARMARHVDSAYQRATAPQWGNAYRGPDQRLEALGLSDAPVTRVAKPAPSPVDDMAVEASIVAASKNQGSGKGKIDQYEKELLKKLVARTLVGQGDLTLSNVAAAVVKFALPGATSIQLASLLARTNITVERALELIEAAQPEPEPESAFADLPVTPDGPDLLLKATLEHNQEGKVLDSPGNLSRIFAGDSDLLGKIRFNALTKEVEVTTAAFSTISSNTLAIGIMNWLDTKWRLATQRSKVEDQLLFVARMNTYNPILNYLHAAAQKWDRTRRIDTWLVDYCGAEDTEFNRRAGGMWLIAACARGIAPGSKVDTVLVFEGKQGSYKSTCFSTLAGPWFSDSPLVIGNKDSQQMASYRWIIELAELASLRASETEAIKAFLSQKIDNYRPPYGKVPEEFKRFAVFGASTNDDKYLPDATGNRRFWPVAISRCDALRLEVDRDQLWGEAAFRYLSAELNPELAHPKAPGERWWFETEEEQIMAAMVVDKRRPENTWCGEIKNWTRRTSVIGAGARRQWTLAEIAKSALDIEIEKLPQKQKGIAEAIKEAGLLLVTGPNGPMWRLPDNLILGAIAEENKLRTN